MFGDGAQSGVSVVIGSRGSKRGTAHPPSNLLSSWSDPTKPPEITPNCTTYITLNSSFISRASGPGNPDLTDMERVDWPLPLTSTFPQSHIKHNFFSTNKLHEKLENLIYLLFKLVF